mmetsp:Transcript_29678/g.28536  ORF Transcript_29678/g.28536 Transcript_29678/m.28536 type:complete len:116 (-) Transcript_29678:481-828(-)
MLVETKVSSIPFVMHISSSLYFSSQYFNVFGFVNLLQLILLLFTIWFILLHKFIDKVILNPWSCTESKSNSQWYSKSSKVDKGKGFGSKFFLVLWVLEIRPMTSDLIVSKDTNRD